MRTKRIVIPAAAVIVVIAVSFLAYGWWTRRGPVTYSRGGTFDATPSASASGSAGPAVGTYRFAATGGEHVKLGSLPACSWPVRDVTLTVGADPSGSVFDLTLGAGRIERAIYTYSRDRITLDFSASTVTCFGVRTTTQDDYQPPAVRYRLPPVVGQRWSTTAVTQDRTEKATVTVLRRERVTVPAGTFDAYVFDVTGSFNGSQSGTFHSVEWFVPSLKTWVKTTQSTRATRSGATFTSDYTLSLVSGPSLG